MKGLAIAVACLMVPALAGPSPAADWKDRTDGLNAKTVLQDTIVGVWVLTKSESAPAGVTVEFTRDGKMIVSAKEGGLAIKVEGTFTHGEKTITSRLKITGDEHQETVKIKKLTNRVLIVEDNHGHIDEFKKK